MSSTIISLANTIIVVKEYKGSGTTKLGIVRAPPEGGGG